MKLILAGDHCALIEASDQNTLKIVVHLSASCSDIIQNFNLIKLAINLINQVHPFLLQFYNKSAVLLLQSKIKTHSQSISMQNVNVYSLPLLSYQGISQQENTHRKQKRQRKKYLYLTKTDQDELIISHHHQRYQTEGHGSDYTGICIDLKSPTKKQEKKFEWRSLNKKKIALYSNYPQILQKNLYSNKVLIGKTNLSNRRKKTINRSSPSLSYAYDNTVKTQSLNKMDNLLHTFRKTNLKQRIIPKSQLKNEIFAKSKIEKKKLTNPIRKCQSLLKKFDYEIQSCTQGKVIKFKNDNMPIKNSNGTKNSYRNVLKKSSKYGLEQSPPQSQIKPIHQLNAVSFGSHKEKLVILDQKRRARKCDSLIRKARAFSSFAEYKPRNSISKLPFEIKQLQIEITPWNEDFIAE